MIRTQIYLPEALHGDLMLLAKQEGVNFSTLVREGAAGIVEKKRAARNKKSDWRKFIGAGGKDGPRDVASKIDYYLYGAGNPKWKKHF